jgi:hypothetical protein
MAAAAGNKADDDKVKHERWDAILESVGSGNNAGMDAAEYLQELRAQCGKDVEGACHMLEYYDSEL